MTTKEIQAKLIDHYSLAIERVKGVEKLDEVRRIIKGMSVVMGICHCAYSLFDTDIFEAEWVSKHCVIDDTWGKFPYYTNSTEEILSRLQLRLDILKKEYSISIETIKPSSV